MIEIVGWHCVRTLVGCKVDLHNRKIMKKLFKQAITKAGGHIRKIIVDQFSNGGLTIIATLQESSADLHTYKEYANSVIVNATTCGKEANPARIIGELAFLLGAEEITRRLIKEIY